MADNNTETTFSYHIITIQIKTISRLKTKISHTQGLARWILQLDQTYSIFQKNRIGGIISFISALLVLEFINHLSIAT